MRSGNFSVTPAENFDSSACPPSATRIPIAISLTNRIYPDRDVVAFLVILSVVEG